MAMDIFSATSKSWSDQPLSLKELVTNHHTILPALLRVVDGFLGIDNLHTFGNSEILYVVEVRTQKRFLLTESSFKWRKRIISIPARHEAKFFVSSSSHDKHHKIHTAKTAMTLEEVTREFAGCCHAVKLDPEIRQRLNVMTDDVASRNIWGMKQLTLKFDECIEEKFLVAHDVSSEECCSKPFVIPIYIPIKVVTLKSNSALMKERSVLWNKLMSLRRADKTFLSEANPHIMLYKTKPASLSEYDTLVPSCQVYEELQPRNHNSGKDYYQKMFHDLTLAKASNSEEIYSEASEKSDLPSKGSSPVRSTPPKVPPKPAKSNILSLQPGKKTHQTPPPPAQLPYKYPPSAAVSQTSTPDDSKRIFDDDYDGGHGAAASAAAAVGDSTTGRTVGRPPVVARKPDVKLRSMTISDVEALCKSVKLSDKSTETLKTQQVDGNLLYDLCESCEENLLETELGLTKLESIKLRKAFFEGWQPKS